MENIQAGYFKDFVRLKSWLLKKWFIRKDFIFVILPA